MPRGGKGRSYPEDFKRSAVELALLGDQSVTEIAKDLGVCNKTLYGWVNRYKKENGLLQEHHKSGDLEAELKHLTQLRQSNLKPHLNSTKINK